MVKVPVHPAYSFHTGFSKFGHKRPWERFSEREREKEAYNRRIYA